MLDLCPVHSPWSPWHTVGIQPRHRWPACLPLSCNCTVGGARGWAGGNGRPAPSTLCPRFCHPWTSARAPPADWHTRIPWSRPGGVLREAKMMNIIIILVKQATIHYATNCLKAVFVNQRPLWLTVVYWIMTLFSSSGLKSVFFCSVARMCFICPTMQFIVLWKSRKNKTVERPLISCF